MMICVVMLMTMYCHQHQWWCWNDDGNHLSSCSCSLRWWNVRNLNIKKSFKDKILQNRKKFLAFSWFTQCMSTRNGQVSSCFVPLWPKHKTNTCHIFANSCFKVIVSPPPSSEERMTGRLLLVETTHHHRSTQLSLLNRSYVWQPEVYFCQSFNICTWWVVNNNCPCNSKWRNSTFAPWGESGLVGGDDRFDEPPLEFSCCRSTGGEEGTFV